MSGPAPPSRRGRRLTGAATPETAARTQACCTVATAGAAPGPLTLIALTLFDDVPGTGRGWQVPGAVLSAAGLLATAGALRDLVQVVVL